MSTNIDTGTTAKPVKRRGLNARDKDEIEANKAALRAEKDAAGLRDALGRSPWVVPGSRDKPDYRQPGGSKW